MHERPTRRTSRPGAACAILTSILCGAATRVSSADEARPPASDPVAAVKGAHQPRPGLITAGQLSEEQMTTLADGGYKHFVSLRPAKESGAGWEEAGAGKLGVWFVRIPIAGADDVTEENARRVAKVLAAAAGPTVLYCASGNRAGALLALSAFHVDGMPGEEALELGRAAGLVSLEPTVREHLGLAPADK